MALTHVASSAWVTGLSTVQPTVPAGTTTDDYVIITLVSKYDDAITQTPPTSPWVDLGSVFNVGRTTGNDNGNLRGRSWLTRWTNGMTMPVLDPTPNNVSTVKASTYRVSAGNMLDYAAEPVKDDTVGTPLVLAATSTLGLQSGDILHFDAVINGDVVTWGTTTATATGATLGTAVVNTADATSTSGTDIRMRAYNYPVTAGTATGNPTTSTVLAGTTTNAVGVGILIRLREVTPVLTTVPLADNIGLTDTLLTEVAKSTAVADNEALTDTVALVADYLRDEPDDMTLADTESHVVDYTRNLAVENVGLTEVFTAQKDSPRFVTDSAGVTETITVEVSNIRGLADGMGMTDSVTTEAVKESGLWLFHYDGKIGG